MEHWRSIPGWIGYEVSDLGRVRSRCRCSTHRLLTPYPVGRGYLRVTLYKGSRVEQYGVFVAKLVMLAFVGPCPSGHQINHKNGIKTNNCLKNLEYCTPKQNVEHASSTGLRDNRGENNPHAKLRRAEIEIILSMVYGGEVQQSIGDLFGVSQHHVSRIKAGRSWVSP